MTEIWGNMTAEARQKAAERSRAYRERHYNMVIDKEREKNKRYREANREKIREKERIRYRKIREDAGHVVTPHPRKPRETETPIVLPRKFGTLDKICQVTG